MPTVQSDSLVFVVDDDASIRDAVKSLLKSVGLRAEVFGSTEEFVNAARPQVPSCLVLDVRLPGMSGLEFQEELAKTGIRIPIIFVTAHGDIPMTSRGSSNPIIGHDISAVLIGCFILAFGGFGFNPGSTAGASAAGNLRIGKIAVAPMLAGCTGTFGALIYM